MPKKAISQAEVAKWVRSAEGKKVLAKALKLAKKASAEYEKKCAVDVEILSRPFTR